MAEISFKELKAAIGEFVPGAYIYPEYLPKLKRLLDAGYLREYAFQGCQFTRVVWNDEKIVDVTNEGCLSPEGQALKQQNLELRERLKQRDTELATLRETVADDEHLLARAIFDSEMRNEAERIAEKRPSEVVDGVGYNWTLVNEHRIGEVLGVMWRKTKPAQRADCERRAKAYVEAAKRWRK